ncbi:MAG: NAD(P)-binding protein [Gemmatimonas sp.]|nr:NAD(P)-binding protein [Gemmatimonas sp.]
MKRSPITRRQFLHRFGAIGGSSLVFGAMEAWGMTGPSAGRRPQLSGRAGDARVIVLGAGISGLVAGYELQRLGYDFRVLEARDRVGGVNHTIRRGTEVTELSGEQQRSEFDEGLYFNCGPWRIPHSHTGLMDYCRELAVPLQIFINETDASYLYYEGEDFGALAGSRIRLREVKSDMWGYTTELLAKALDQNQLDLAMSGEDEERLVEYLVRAGYLDSEDYTYRGSDARGEGSPHDLSLLLQSGFGSRVQSIDSGNGAQPMFQPIGGMDQIPMAFQRALGDRITLGAEVVSVRQTPDEVAVVYRDTGTGEEQQVTADYVISCLPMPILRRLDVDLSPEVAAVVQDLEYSTSAKMGLQMRRRFWEQDDGIFGGHLYSNLPIGQFSYPSNDYLSEKGVLLGFYGSGDIADLAEQPVEARLRHVITETSKAHPQIAEEYETGFAVFWQNIEYSRGAYGRNPGEERLALLSQPDNRLYLGCAGASDNPAWMEGAISAAWRTVESVHERAQAE